MSIRQVKRDLLIGFLVILAVACILSVSLKHEVLLRNEQAADWPIVNSQVESQFLNKLSFGEGIASVTCVPSLSRYVCVLISNLGVKHSFHLSVQPGTRLGLGFRIERKSPTLLEMRISKTLASSTAVERLVGDLVEQINSRYSELLEKKNHQNLIIYDKK